MLLDCPKLISLAFGIKKPFAKLEAFLIELNYEAFISPSFLPTFYLILFIAFSMNFVIFLESSLYYLLFVLITCLAFIEEKIYVIL